MSEDWYKHEPKKFIDGVHGIGPAFIGAYKVVLDLIYINDGDCVDDPAFIGSILGCPGRQARALIDGLIERGKLHHNERGRLANAKASKVIEERSTLLRHARDTGATGGRRSADARVASNKNKELGQGGLDREDKRREDKKKKTTSSSLLETTFPKWWPLETTCVPIRISISPFIIRSTSS